MLLDHFHPPLSSRRHWSGFHARWAGNIAADLNRTLPDGWFAEPGVHWAIEIDVAAFREEQILVGAGAGERDSGAWEPPAPAKSIGFSLTTDVVEVQVFHQFGDVPLAGAIELVSPANKDRPEAREAFVSKCDGYLRGAIGLVVADLVTERQANLHVELMERLGETERRDEAIYASAYRPVKRSAGTRLEIWYEPLVVGQPLPSLPLYLKDGPRMQVNLADTYRSTCIDLRIPVDGGFG